MFERIIFEKNLKWLLEHEKKNDSWKIYVKVSFGFQFLHL